MNKLSSEVQDVDRCVNEKQNSDSGEIQQKAPCFSQTAIPQDSLLDATHTWTRAFPGKDGYFWMRFADPPSEAMMVEVTVMGNLRETGMVGDVRNRVDIGACEFLGPIPLPPITQDAGGLPSTTALDPGQASQPKSASTLVTVDEAARRAAEKIVNTLAPHELQYEQYYRRHKMSKDTVLNQVAEIIATELNVHQPDVQAAAKRAREIVDEFRFSFGTTETLRFLNTEPLVEAIATALAASPVQPEVSKEQDNAKS